MKQTHGNRSQKTVIQLSKKRVRNNDMRQNGKVILARNLIIIPWVGLHIERHSIRVTIAVKDLTVQRRSVRLYICTD